MLLLKSQKVYYESALPAKAVKKKFDKRVIPFKARGSIIEVSSFIKKYKTAEVFYGGREGNKLRLSHHAPRKTDGSGATFYGEIRENGEGSVIEGKISLPIATRIFTAIWLAAVLFFALICFALETYSGALAFAVTAAVSVLIIFRDSGKTNKLRAELEKLCEDE